MKKTSIGFGADLKDCFDEEENIIAQVTNEDLREYGFIPEFIGRLPMIFTLEGLTKEMLVKILKEPKNAILKQYQKLLELDEVKLEFDEGALEAIARTSSEKENRSQSITCDHREIHARHYVRDTKRRHNRKRNDHKRLY